MRASSRLPSRRKTSPSTNKSHARSAELSVRARSCWSKACAAAGSRAAAHPAIASSVATAKGEARSRSGLTACWAPAQSPASSRACTSPMSTRSRSWDSPTVADSARYTLTASAGRSARSSHQPRCRSAVESSAGGGASFTKRPSWSTAGPYWPSRPRHSPSQNRASRARAAGALSTSFVHACRASSHRPRSERASARPRRAETRSGGDGAPGRPSAPSKASRARAGWPSWRAVQPLEFSAKLATSSAGPSLATWTKSLSASAIRLTLYSVSPSQ